MNVKKGKQQCLLNLTHRCLLFGHVYDIFWKIYMYFFWVVLLFELFVLVCCSGICCYFGCRLLWFCFYWFVVLVLLCYCFCCGVLLLWFCCLFLGSWGGFVKWGDKIRIISAPLLDSYLALLLGFGHGGGQENVPRKHVEPYRGESSLPRGRG